MDKPYKGVRHYIGYTDNLEQRMHEHVMGSKGARLLQVVRDAGISFHVARTWEGDRKLERKLKKRKNAKYLCPECEKERRESNCS